MENLFLLLKVHIFLLQKNKSKHSLLDKTITSLNSNSLLDKTVTSLNSNIVVFYIYARGFNQQEKRFEILNIVDLFRNFQSK